MVGKTLAPKNAPKMKQLENQGLIKAYWPESPGCRLAIKNPAARTTGKSLPVWA
jgi:hypothetical protein